MTNLTRLISLLTFLSNLYFQTVSAQIVPAVDNKVVTLEAGTEVNDIYIPPDPSLTLQIEPREVQFIINYIGQWPSAAEGAFEYAVGLWGRMLTSAPDVEIHINAELVPQGSLGPTGLGQSNPGALFTNFGSSNPTYQSETFYPIALANRLNGSDLSGLPDIEVKFVEDTDNNLFYYSTTGQCPSDKYDFVTVALHEIGHAIGLLTSNSDIFTYGLTGADGVRRPTIADRFIIDGNGTKLTDFPMGSTPLSLIDFFTSDNLFWNTTTGTKMYAPEQYNASNSIGHIDYDTYDDTENALFKYKIDMGEAIHSPGIVGINILTDIGWEAQLITGIEDNLTISSSFDIDCWNNPPCGSFDGLLYGTPKSTI